VRNAGKLGRLAIDRLERIRAGVKKALKGLGNARG
jgi:hypothetical protein